MHIILAKSFVHAAKWRLHKFFYVIYFVVIQKAVKPIHPISAGGKGQDDYSENGQIITLFKTEFKPGPELITYEFYSY